MSEEDSKKETNLSKALPVATIVTCLATAFAISSGLFDRGAQTGVNTEKVQNFEKTLSRLDASMAEVRGELKGISADLQRTMATFQVLNERDVVMKEDLERLNRRMDNIKR